MNNQTGPHQERHTTAHGPNLALATACSYVAPKLRMVFTFLKPGKGRRICNRDVMWPAKSKICPIWLFREKKCLSLLPLIPQATSLSDQGFPERVLGTLI